MNTNSQINDNPVPSAGETHNETSTQQSSVSRALSTTESDLLSANDRSEAEIQAFDTQLSNRTKKAKKKNVNLAALIAEHKEQLLALAPRKPLWTARMVADGLAKLGYYKVVRGPNAFGDSLGAKGHDLPKLKTNPTLYYLPGIGRTQEENRAVQEQLDSARREVIRELTAQFDEVNEEGQA